MTSPVPENAHTLADLGIEEVERSACEDTYENRKLLRSAGWTWTPLYDHDGAPTSLIRALTPAEVTEVRTSIASRKQNVLSDPKNPWSNYLHPLDLPADAEVPWWVRTRIRDYVQAVDAGKTGEDLPSMPVRCEIVRDDGTRCWNWTCRRDRIPRCGPHLTKPQEATDTRRLAAARLKLIQAAPAAVDTLEQLMESSSSEPVRLGASKEILDRAGIRGGVEVDSTVTVEVTDPAQVIRDRLTKLAEAAARKQELEDKTIKGELASPETQPETATSSQEDDEGELQP